MTARHALAGIAIATGLTVLLALAAGAGLVIAFVDPKHHSHEGAHHAH